jgi:hypothetical protein
VLTEGAGKVRQFRTVTRDFDGPVYSGGGWESIRLKHDLAQHAVEEYEKNARPTVALHCGDFDPDGVEIFESGIADVRAFIDGMLDGWAEPDEVFRVERLMLTPEQVAEHVPEEDRDVIDRAEIKARDWRGQKWPHPYKCELEALSIPVRLEILRARLGELIDLDRVSAVREQGEEEREKIVGRIGELLAGEEA